MTVFGALTFSTTPAVNYDPEMIRHARLTIATTILTAASLIAPMSAGAGERGVEVGWLEPFPLSATIDHYFDFTVSDDLTTAAMSDDCDHPGVVFVALPTGNESRVTGSPSGACNDSEGFGQPAIQEPYIPIVHAVTEDGRALVTAPWEGVVTDDVDGGQSDAFLVERNGERHLLSGGIDDRQVRGATISDGGTRAVLISFDENLGDPRLHLVDDGTLSTIPVASPETLDWSEDDVTISDDGHYLFLPRRTGILERIDLDTSTVVSIPMNSICCGLRQFAVSGDGETAAWISADDTFSTYSNTVTIWSDGRTVTYPFAPTVAQSHRIEIEAGQVFGATRHSVPDTDVLLGYRFWSLDIEIGRVQTLIDEGPHGGPFMMVGAVAEDGRSAVLSTMGPVGYEPAAPEVAQTGRLATRQFLWDADLTPPARPGSDPSIANQVERLYRAFLLRGGDGAGLRFWVDQIADGGSLGDVADSFAASAEFTQRYGTLDDDAFVDLLYRNVLDRVPDDAGFTYWRGLLDAGESRGDIVAAMSAAPEFVQRTGTLAPRPSDEAALRRLYAGYFLREADDSGLDYWLPTLRDGSNLSMISQAFADSHEFDDVYGDLADEQFVLIAYLNVFGRYPDEGGRVFWNSELDRGVARGDLMVELSQSVEFVGLTTSRTP